MPLVHAPYERLRLAAARLHPVDAACLAPTDDYLTLKEATARARLAEALADGEPLDLDELRALVLKQRTCCDRNGDGTGAYLWAGEWHAINEYVAACTDPARLLAWLRNVRRLTIHRYHDVLHAHHEAA